MSEDIKTVLTDEQRQAIGEAINKFFGENDNQDGTFAFDPYDARDVDLLIDALPLSAGLSASASAKPDMDAAKRLRLLCNMLGLKHGVPDDDAMLMKCQFSVFGVMRAALEASASDKKDAERWREALCHVGAQTDSTEGGRRFTFHRLRPIRGANIMRGSIAQHFTDTIDATIAANAGKDKGDV